MKKLLLAIMPALLLIACNQQNTTSNPRADRTAVITSNNTDTVRSRETGPMSGTVMTKDYVYYMGKQMYFWGWPLVNLHNRLLVMEHIPEAGMNGGAVPVAPLNNLCMLTDYITPDQRYVACP